MRFCCRFSRWAASRVEPLSPRKGPAGPSAGGSCPPWTSRSERSWPGGTCVDVPRSRDQGRSDREERPGDGRSRVGEPGKVAERRGAHDFVRMEAGEFDRERDDRITEDPIMAFPDYSRNVSGPSVVGSVVMPSKKTSQNDGVRRSAARMAAALEPQDHAVLALRFGENLSVGETAAVLRMNPDEVRSTVKRVVGMLHRRIDS